MRLSDDKLCAVDICGDGNCFFRSLSICMYANEKNHGMLRKKIVQYMIDDCYMSADQLCADDKKEILQQLYLLRKNGSWVGEDVIVAAATYLKQTVKVYSAAGNSPLLIYDPLGVTTSDSALPLAFFETGHYKAALSSSAASALLTLLSPSLATPCFPPSSVTSSGKSPTLSSSASSRAPPGVPTSSSASSHAPSGVPTSSSASSQAPFSVPTSSSTSLRTPPGVLTSSSVLSVKTSS